MDAYDISNRVKDLWTKHIDRSSGTLNRGYGKMKMCVWTLEGYREVVNVTYNEKLKIIELVLDSE
jgi:hypothetical protein